MFIAILDTGTAESAGFKALSSGNNPPHDLHTPRTSSRLPTSPSHPDGEGTVQGSSATQISLAVQDFPYQPRDIIEWVYLRARPLQHKVSIAYEGHAFTQYEMELTQRTE